MKTSVRLLATPSPLIQYNAAFLLYMLSTTKGKVYKGTLSPTNHTHYLHRIAEIRAQMVKEGAVDLLSRLLLLNSDVQTQEMAMQALMNISSDGWLVPNPVAII